jgi:hypothetical protein
MDDDARVMTVRLASAALVPKSEAAMDSSATEACWYGSAVYPAHAVPLAPYPSPGGIGLVWAPFGWGHAQAEAQPNTRLKIVSTCLK